MVRLQNEVASLGLLQQKEEALDFFREREARQAEREEAERERQDEAEAERERQAWEAYWIEYALDSIPKDAPADVQLNVHQAVEQVLAALQPTQPDSFVQRITDAAVERALAPWMRLKETRRAIEAACRRLPPDIQHCPEFADLKQRAVEAAGAAITKLPEGTLFDDFEATAINAMKPVVIAYEDLQARRRIISSVTLSTTSDEMEEAREAVDQALKALPVGVAVAQLERAKETALAPYRARIAERERAAKQRQQEQMKRMTAEFQLAVCLGHIEEYLRKEYEYDDGYRGLVECRKDAERIREMIRETLVKEYIANPQMDVKDIHRRIEQLVDDNL